MKKGVYFVPVGNNRQDDCNNLEIALLKLVDEKARNTYKKPLSATDISALFVCLPLAAISSAIYYQPNLLAGKDVSEALHIPQNIAKGILVTGGIGTNFVLNGYFSYSVPIDIVSRIKAISWPDPIPKTLLGKINYNQRRIGTIVFLAITNTLKLILKCIPVALSAAQYVALGIDDNLGTIALFAEFLTYGLMHWFAVTHFIENWANAVIDYSSEKLSWFNSQWRNRIDLKKKQKTLHDYLITRISATVNGINCALAKNNTESLIKIYRLHSELLDMSPSNPNRYAKAFDLFAAIVNFEYPSPKNAKLHPAVMMFLHLLNAVLIKCCYIGYDLSVWQKVPEFCDSILHHKICYNDFFITPIRIITLAPLSYLVVVIAAPGNTNKLINFIVGTIKGNYVKPLALQRDPKKVYFIAFIVFFMSALSWGTTIMLNNNYIHQKELRYLANINSIAYNSYFHVFPLPFVSLGLATLLSRMYYRMSDFWNNKTLKSSPFSLEYKHMGIQKFLSSLLTEIKLMSSKKLLHQIKKMDEKRINTLFEKAASPETQVTLSVNLPNNGDSHINWSQYLNQILSDNQTNNFSENRHSFWGKQDKNVGIMLIEECKEDDGRVNDQERFFNPARSNNRCCAQCAIL